MRRCKLCVKFKTHCWRRTCDQCGGRRQRRSFTSICRGLCWTSAGYLPVNPRWRMPCTACRIPAASCWYCCKQATNKLQWNREPTLTNRHPYPVSPPSKCLNTFGTVRWGAWHVYEKLYRWLSQRQQEEKEGAVFMLDCAACYVVHRLACSRLARTLRLLFLFDFLIVYFSSRPAAVLHLWPTQQEVYGLDSHWE